MLLILISSITINLMLFVPGACITACRGTGRHILALEEDKDIFEAVLSPMRRIPPVVVPAEAEVDVEPSQDPDAMPIVARVFTKKTKPSK